MAEQSATAQNQSGQTGNSGAEKGAQAGNGAAAGGAGSGQGTGQGWFSTLPEDLRGLPSITRYKSLETFARSHLGLEKKLGTTIAPPGPEATDEERAEFFTRLGRPESADKYSFKLPEIVSRVAESLGQDPKNVIVDENFVKAAREAFHKEGITDTQASKMTEFYIGAQISSLQAQAKQIEEGVKEVQHEWGHAYESNVAVAHRAIERLDGDIPGLAKVFDDPRFGSNPALIKLFHFLGAAMGEDVAERGMHKPGADDGAEIKKQIATIRNNPDHPFNQGNHAGHKAAVKEMNDLYAQLEGEN